MALEGMEVESVKQFGNQLKQAAEHNEQQFNQHKSKFHGLDWKGPDRERTLGELDALFNTLKQVLEQIKHMGENIVKQAHEQEQASSR